MKSVYKDELKPIHPMIEALRSKDPNKIARYSDLTVPAVDKKILELSLLLDSAQDRISISQRFGGNEQAVRLFGMLADMGYESNLLEPLILRAFEEHPNLKIPDLMPIILTWYQEGTITREKTTKKPQEKRIRKEDWHSLDSDDLRFLHSQAANEDELYTALKSAGVIFDTASWLAQSNQG